MSSFSVRFKPFPRHDLRWEGSMLSYAVLLLFLCVFPFPVNLSCVLREKCSWVLPLITCFFSQSGSFRFWNFLLRSFFTLLPLSRHLISSSHAFLRRLCCCSLFQTPLSISYMFLWSWALCESCFLFSSYLLLQSLLLFCDSRHWVRLRFLLESNTSAWSQVSIPGLWRMFRLPRVRSLHSYEHPIRVSN